PGWSAVVSGADGVVVGGDGFRSAGVFVVEPLAGPDPVEAPALPFELFLAEPVAVAGAVGGVVGGTVAFDRQDVPAGLERVLGSEVVQVSGVAVMGGEFEI